ncbi:MAG: HugZ family protein [Clostridium sp.]
MENLINSKKTLMISSIDNEGNPSISYAPFIMKDKYLYIYISKTAPHYTNIDSDRKIDVMIIEDESEAKSLWARGRASFMCTAKLADNEEEILNLYEEIHGSNIMSVLKTMDFNVFKLSIINGRLIKGFGQAFKIEIEDGEWKVTQIVGDGHKSKKL